MAAALRVASDSAGVIKRPHTVADVAVTFMLLRRGSGETFELAAMPSRVRWQGVAKTAHLFADTSALSGFIVTQLRRRVPIRQADMLQTRLFVSRTNARRGF